jgi:hypothetical protein
MFWTYEQDVPEELRHEAPRGDPRVLPLEYDGVSKADPRVCAYYAAEEKYRALKRKRMLWLLNGGQDYLRSGETEAIRSRLEKARP